MRYNITNKSRNFQEYNGQISKPATRGRLPNCFINPWDVNAEEVVRGGSVGVLGYKGWLVGVSCGQLLADADHVIASTGSNIPKLWMELSPNIRNRHSP